MKKVFNRNGDFYGIAKKIEKVGNNLIITMSGNFPGMTERSVIFEGGEIIFEDKDRLYIEY